MQCRGWLAGLVTVLTLGAWTSIDAVEQPNVILIVADDLGAMDLGCYGSKFHRTPALDQMAAEGLRFTQAYAACHVCSPTRASIMTGQWPARLQITDWLPGRRDLPDQRLARPIIRQELPLEARTLAEDFKAAGYATGHIGKWHLGGEGFGPEQQGFDRNIAGDHTGSPADYFAPYANRQRSIPHLQNAPQGEYLTERLGREGAKFVEQHAQEPFFLHLAHYAVHTPLRAPADLIAQFPAATPFKGEQNNPIYAAMLLSLDQAVGEVLKKVDSLGLRERTLVIFTSDNGGLATNEGPNTPATSNAPLREGKGYFYEGGIRVPLIVRAPGRVAAGSLNSAVVCSIDFMPTLRELCQLEPASAVDGVSFASVLQGAALPQRDALYWHYPHYSNQMGRPGSAIRAGNYKLIEFFDTGRQELFDLANDPRENKNLIDEQPDLAKRLAAQLAKWRDDVGAQMMTPNPNYQPNRANENGEHLLHARNADVHGATLRYEPLPHKLTLGYWMNPADWASWEVAIDTPGEYEVEFLQGCGHGSGGSRVACTLAGQTLEHTVVETGGFQEFRPFVLGKVTINKPGRYELAVKPIHKPGLAVMDLRQVTLRPVQK